MQEQLTPAEQEEVQRALKRLDANAWGVALGLLFGLGLFFATIVLVLKGGPNVGQHLGLLGNYFPGYTVTMGGAFVGLGWAFATGYVFGRLVGAAYNRLAPSQR